MILIIDRMLLLVALLALEMVCVGLLEVEGVHSPLDPYLYFVLIFPKSTLFSIQASVRGGRR